MTLTDQFDPCFHLMSASDLHVALQVVVQVITLAFLVVACSVGVMIPIMLYVLDLHSSGWTWQYVALFISMLASTDAVAIIATMKTSRSQGSSSFPCSSLREGSLYKRQLAQSADLVIHQLPLCIQFRLTAASPFCFEMSLQKSDRTDQRRWLVCTERMAQDPGCPRTKFALLYRAL